MKHEPDITDPKAHEAAKTREDRAADVAYTVNHAISCGATDIFVQPFASAGIVTAAQSGKLPKGLHWLTKLFEHSDMPQGSWFKKLFHNTKHWFGAEVIGDVTAIIPTVAMQRLAPGFMHNLRVGLEPIFGGMFHRGAKRDARHWAIKHNLAPDSLEAEHKEAQLYEHEMSHLPQAATWNAFSIGIGFFAMRGLSKLGHHHHGGGHHHPHVTTFGQYLVGKTFGSIFSNFALIGGRAMYPETFNEWDRKNSENIVRPIMRKMSRLSGGDDKTIDNLAKKEDQLRGADWQSRMEQETPPEQGRQ